MLEYQCGTYQLDYSKAKFWTIEVDIKSPYESIAINGDNITLFKNKKCSIVIHFPFIEHELVTIEPNKLYIKTLTANMIPIYARIKNNKLRLSNNIYFLLNKNDDVKISFFVLSQQLRGVDYPQKNIYYDIEMLEASAIYSIENGKIKYESTTLLPVKNIKPDDIYQIIYDNYELLFKDGRPISVLLSGGYDSRLNLAFAQYYSKKHGNELIAFHEYKNQPEFEIARSVADAAGVKFIYKNRDSFYDYGQELLFNRDFIILQSGSYRQNLLRWHGYLEFIKRTVPNCLIIGLGAEAHKGKYYFQVDNLKNDPIRIFGIQDSIIKKIAEYLDVEKYDKNSQNEFFSNLIKHAKVYNDKYSIIDFLHYHTYIANGYGQRCYDLIQCFDFSFPFLDDKLLQSVFSLNFKDKIAFKITSDLITQLAPNLMNIPFTSANDKSLHKDSVVELINKKIKHNIKKYYTMPLKSINRNKLTEYETNQLKRYSNPKSEITKKLYCILKDECKNTPGLHMDYALEFYLFFLILEEELSINFQLV